MTDYPILTIISTGRISMMRQHLPPVQGLSVISPLNLNLRYIAAETRPAP